MQQTQVQARGALWRVQLLGGVRAEGLDRVVERFPTQKTTALFAYLALHAERPHPREELLDLLWPDAPLEATRNRLNQALSSLRRQFEGPEADFGSVLLSDRLTVQVNPALVVTDVSAFESGRSAARVPEPGLRFRRLREALGRYGGDLLPGLYEDWVVEDRERLQGAYVTALADAVAAAAAAVAPDREVFGPEEVDAAVGIARRLVALEGDVEEHHLNLVRLLALSGDAAAAERHYREVERRLRAEGGERPALPLAQLVVPPVGVRRTAAGWAAPAAVPSPPARTPVRLLPSLPSRMFGREREMATARRLLVEEGCRVLTVCGAGGCGKTKLSVEVANEIADSEGWDCCFIPLAAVDAADRVPDAILHCLKPQRQRAASRPTLDQLVEELARWDRPLLVLDNFEQLVDGWSPVLARLLGAVPGLRCIVASRRRLNLEGERVIPVAPLPFPDRAAAARAAPADLLGYPSVQLFLDRAQAVRPDFQITPRNAETVRLLCERLEGIPLAIELAAAWAHTLTAAQMLDGLSHRFTLLVSRRRDIPPRHRTLWATVEYSYRLLAPELQGFFASLSVFDGGWTLEAAEAVCAEPEAREYLGRLIENSLVVAEAGAVTGAAEPGAMRYRMLETIREYGWQQLTGDQRAVLAGRHAEYFTRLAGEASAEGHGQPRGDALDRMGEERGNFGAALRWCHETELPTMGLRLASRLTPFWEIRGPLTEGSHWLRSLLDLPQEDVPRKDVAEALSALGRIAWHQSDYAAAADAQARCLALQKEAGDAAGTARSLYDLGIVEIRRCRYDAAKEYLEESLAIASALGDAPGVARSLLNLGNIAKYRGRYAEAKAYFEQSLATERSLGNLERVAMALNNLAVLALQEGSFPAAEYLLEQASKTFAELGSASGVGLARLNQGKLAARRGQLAEAIALFRESTRVHAEVGSRFFLVEAVVELSDVALRRGHDYAAAVGAAAADRLLRSLQAGLPPADAGLLNALLADTADRLTPDVRAVAMLQAAALGEESAVAYLLESLDG